MAKRRRGRGGGRRGARREERSGREALEDARARDASFPARCGRREGGAWLVLTVLTGLRGAGPEFESSSNSSYDHATRLISLFCFISSMLATPNSA